MGDRRSRLPRLSETDLTKGPVTRPWLREVRRFPPRGAGNEKETDAAAGTAPGGVSEAEHPSITGYNVASRSHCVERATPRRRRRRPGSSLRLFDGRTFMGACVPCVHECGALAPTVRTVVICPHPPYGSASTTIRLSSRPDLFPPIHSTSVPPKRGTNTDRSFASVRPITWCWLLPRVEVGAIRGADVLAMASDSESGLYQPASGAVGVPEHRRDVPRGDATAFHDHVVIQDGPGTT
jgi:hypothetical protein